MAAIVYALCAITSVMCAGLLLRTYLKTRASLIFWCLLAFVGLAANNILLFYDMIIIPESNLSVIRNIPALLGVGVLLWGLVWDSA